MNLNRGKKALIGACLIHLCIGYISVWGGLLPYFVSYFRYKGDKNLTTSELNIVAPIMQLFIFIG